MKSILIFIVVLCSFTLKAQNTMYFMEGMPQTIQYNPAFHPDLKFYIGLPALSGIKVNAYNTGFSYNEFKDFSDNVGRKEYNPDEFVNSIGGENRFFGDGKLNLFSMGFAMKNESFFSVCFDMNDFTTVKANSDFVYLLADYDKLQADDFPLVADNIDFMTNNYLSLSVTYSRKINENLRVGISPHLNLNMAGAKARNMTYSVELEESGNVEREYDTSISGDIILGLPVQINPDAVDGNIFDPDEGLLEEGWGNDVGISELLKNKSLSFDIGATYCLQKWTFSASLLNIGASSWKTNAYKLSGSNDEINIQESDKIKIGIPAKIYLGVSRQFVSKWNYGLVFRNTFYEGRNDASASLSLNGELGKFLMTSLSYSTGYKYDNIGLGLRLKILPGTDLYFVTDNVIQTFKFKNAHRMSLAFGLNIAVAS